MNADADFALPLPARMMCLMLGAPEADYQNYKRWSDTLQFLTFGQAIKARPLDQRLRPLLPGYMTMGQDGMGDMGDMGMAVPENSIPMVGAHGPYDYITMGGMFTLLKVRDQLASYDDPGWYQSPPTELAQKATVRELQRDGIAVPS